MEEHPNSADGLRRRAEPVVRARVAQTTEELDSLSPEETRRMLYELRVHQIELEMQNEELRRVQAELDAERSRYFDLYDVAPVGYCSLSDRGVILEANLTAANMLGIERRALAGRPLTRFIRSEDQDLHYFHQKKLLDSGEQQAYELRMQRRDGTSFWARLETAVWRRADGPVAFRAVISDVSDRKRVEAELRKSEERLNFEELLTDLSSHFINLPQGRLDSEIEDAQRRICLCMGVDACTLFRTAGEGLGTFEATHAYMPPALAPVMEHLDFARHAPWCATKLIHGESLTLSSVTDVPAEAASDIEFFRRHGFHAVLALPLSAGGGPVFGALVFWMTRTEHSWVLQLVHRLQTLAQVFANVIIRSQLWGLLQERLLENEQLRQRLERENTYLQGEVRYLAEHREIVGQSPEMKAVIVQVGQVARTQSTVLLLGETGTGKELLARAIHLMSLRKDRPMVTVNCAALPPTLFESELFGREKGAYTGALTRMAGRFEIADGSTLFLDEIGDIPLVLQTKLLRVLEEGTFERLGSTRSQHVDVRVIAATNRDLAHEVAAGRFRKDLFYRLNVFPIVVPPLRKRPGDIPILVEALVQQLRTRIGKEIGSISEETMEALRSYSWPGNIRELRNVIEHAMITSIGKTLEIRLPDYPSQPAADASSLADQERKFVLATLEKTGWRVAGPNGAAEGLGLKRTTLQAKMKKLRIQRPSRHLPK
jgi:PAS domain S-box-containing protein